MGKGEDPNCAGRLPMVEPAAPTAGVVPRARKFNAVTSESSSSARHDEADLISFYEADYDEAARLIRPYNRLELERTRELLAARLPTAPARVLDVGGGTGI